MIAYLEAAICGHTHRYNDQTTTLQSTDTDKYRATEPNGTQKTNERVQPNEALSTGFLTAIQTSVRSRWLKTGSLETR